MNAVQFIKQLVDLWQPKDRNKFSTKTFNSLKYKIPFYHMPIKVRTKISKTRYVDTNLKDCNLSILYDTTDLKFYVVLNVDVMDKQKMVIPYTTLPRTNE